MARGVDAARPGNVADGDRTCECLRICLAALGGPADFVRDHQPVCCRRVDRLIHWAVGGSSTIFINTAASVLARHFVGGSICDSAQCFLAILTSWKLIIAAKKKHAVVFNRCQAGGNKRVSDGLE